MIVIRHLIRSRYTLASQKCLCDANLQNAQSSISRSVATLQRSVSCSRSNSASGTALAVNDTNENNDPTGLPMKITCRTYATRRGMQPRKPDRVITGEFRDIDMDPAMFKLGFEDIEELNDADENVKKIFSLEYASSREVQVKKGTMLVEKVREDEFKPSHEAKIAILTVKIRKLAEYMKDNKKDKLNKRRLLEMIDRRNQLLGYLRRNNFERFQWLLEELGIQYSVPPVQIIRLSKRQQEERAVKQKAYFDRKRALYEYFKQKIADADADAEENDQEKAEKKS